MSTVARVWSEALARTRDTISDSSLGRDHLLALMTIAQRDVNARTLAVSTSTEVELTPKKGIYHRRELWDQFQVPYGPITDIFFQQRELRRVTLTELRQLRQDWPRASGQPRGWAVYGHEVVVLFPRPIAGVRVTFKVAKVLDELKSEEQELELPPHLVPLFVDHLTGLLFLRRRMFDEARLLLRLPNEQSPSV